MWRLLNRKAGTIRTAFLRALRPENSCVRRWEGTLCAGLRQIHSQAVPRNGSRAEAREPQRSLASGTGSTGSRRHASRHPRA